MVAKFIFGAYYKLKVRFWFYSASNYIIMGAFQRGKAGGYL
jgi:hypothetical protein